MISNSSTCMAAIWFVSSKEQITSNSPAISSSSESLFPPYLSLDAALFIVLLNIPSF
jgi:hypothetical protein